MLSSLRILGRNDSGSTERWPGKQSFTSQFLYFRASRPWPRDTQGLTDWCILNACAPTTMGVSGHLAKVAEVLSFRDHPWSYTSIHHLHSSTFIICHIELQHPYTTLQSARSSPFPFMQVSKVHRHYAKLHKWHMHPPLLLGEGWVRRDLEQSMKKSVLVDSTLQSARSSPFPFMQVSKVHRHYAKLHKWHMHPNFTGHPMLSHFTQIAVNAKHLTGCQNCRRPQTSPKPGGKW